MIVAVLNLAYFGVEFGVARAIGSVSLFADSIDFLEDAAINLLIGLTLMASLATRARVGKLLAIIILAPAVATLWMAWTKFQTPVAPEPFLLSATGAGALAINLTCAFLLARFRAHRQRTGLLRSERVGASSHAGHVFGSSERATELFDKAQSPVRGIEP